MTQVTVMWFPVRPGCLEISLRAAFFPEPAVCAKFLQNSNPLCDLAQVVPMNPRYYAGMVRNFSNFAEFLEMARNVLCFHGEGE